MASTFFGGTVGALAMQESSLEKFLSPHHVA